jgi:excinuclease ABC subunit C
VPRLEFEARQYPTAPGCYAFKDTAGQVLYIGKAVDLRRRLASYFSQGHRHPRIHEMVHRAASVEVIVVHNEAESLILENNLIKQYRPRYNRMLKADGTGYFYIALTREPFPRLLPYRKQRFNPGLLAPDGRFLSLAARFGPYVDRTTCHHLLDLTLDWFRLRTCHPLGSHPCLRFHMNRCPGVCQGGISRAEYAQAVRGATALLLQPQPALLARLRAEMTACADRLEFERAQRIKRKIEALESSLQPQVVERHVPHDEDIVYFGPTAVVVAHVERGMLRGMETFASFEADGPGSREDFLVRHYAGAPAPGTAAAQDVAPSLPDQVTSLPDEIVIDALDDPAAVENSLAAAGHSVAVTLAHSEDHCRLLHLCRLNHDHNPGPPIAP